MAENLKPADIHVKDSRLNRVFIYSTRSDISQRHPEYSAEQIQTALEQIIATQPVEVALRPHQFAIVPRVHHAQGQCNWQIVVFLPVPPEDLAAINMAGADLQKRCNMIDEYQNTRGIIV